MRLGRYKAALDAGADPAVIGAWITDCRNDRERAARDLTDATPAPAMTDAEIDAMVAWFAETTDRFRQAMEATSPEARQRFYDRPGLRAYYTPGTDEIEVTLQPGGKGRVEGGT